MGRRMHQPDIATPAGISLAALPVEERVLNRCIA